MKRRCETCRFFLATDNSGIGRCLNPNHIGSGLPFIVRATELNCRSGWSKDLWEPAVNGEGLAAEALPNAEDAAGEPFAVVLSTQREVEPAPRVAGDGAEAGDGVDLLVEVSPLPRSVLPVPEANPVTTEIGGATAGDERPDDHRDRELIRRAHDVHRLRLANRTRTAGGLSGQPAEPGPATSPGGSSPSDVGFAPAATEPEASGGAAAPAVRQEAASTDGASTEAPPSTAETLAARMAALAPVPPVPVSEMRTDMLGWGANRQEAEHRFDSVPPIDPTFSLPFREKQRTTRLRAGFDDRDLPAAEELGSSAAGSSEPASKMESAGASQPAGWDAAVEEGAVDHRPADIWPAPDAGARDDMDLTESTSGRVDGWPQDRPGAVPTWDLAAGAASLYPEEGFPRAFRPSRFDEELDPEPDVLPNRPSPAASAGAADRWNEQPLDSVPSDPPTAFPPPHPAATVYDEAADYPADMWPPFDYLADLPRCCRTCRDFRPADGGERGWCTSAWAFQHRRMVHADELPCLSAVGAWWLPADDVWLDDLDVDHAHPTPLVDAMLARRTRVDGPTPRVRRRGRR